MTSSTEWLSETLYPDWTQSFRILREIAREQSDFQEIRIMETASHGRLLLLDGCVQITEADEFIYQEMIAHVPLIQHGAAERVLVIGAGDGGVLRRVLQHRRVRQAVMVEIDEAVIRLVREHMPAVAGNAWHDPRAQVVIGNGVAYLAAAAAASFDIVIVDSTDPAGVGETLFTDAFYQDCERVLTPSGLVVNQCGVPFMQAAELQATSLRRARHFPYVSAYIAAVPTYVGGFMALGIAAKQPIQQLAHDELARRGEAAGIMAMAEYWSPGVHQGAFALPPYIARLLPS